MVKGMKRLKDIGNNVEMDSIHMEKYVKELSKVCWDMFRLTGAMFEQEHLRIIATKYTRGTMEHKVITNVRCVNGGRSLFRQ